MSGKKKMIFRHAKPSLSDNQPAGTAKRMLLSLTCHNMQRFLKAYGPNCLKPVRAAAKRGRLAKAGQGCCKPAEAATRLDWAAANWAKPPRGWIGPLQSGADWPRLDRAAANWPKPPRGWTGLLQTGRSCCKPYVR